MLIRDITFVNFPLTLRRQEGWIGQDKPSQSLGVPTGDHSRCHASHRMAK
jgi:hypothetical protein